jgi:Uma2 family endonuclease
MREYRVLGSSRPHKALGYGSDQPVSSLDYDRSVKTTLYAEAGIGEIWIINLKNSLVEFHSRPVRAEYKYAHTVARGETLTLPAGLPGTLNVDDLLGEEVHWKDA